MEIIEIGGMNLSLEGKENITETAARRQPRKPAPKKAPAAKKAAVKGNPAKAA